MSSILDDVKHMLGLLPAETAFDIDVTIHINTVFTTLKQLGVGPPEGFFIEDNTADWSEFIPDERLNGVKSYMFLRVKSIFDPPATGFTQAAMERQILELEWRLRLEAEEQVLSPLEPIIIDGGGV